AAAISVPQKTLIVSLLGMSSRHTVLFFFAAKNLSPRARVRQMGPSWRSPGHPFHQAIELIPDIIDCRLLEIVRGRPVHKRTGCARLHVVVDRGAPDCQRDADDKPKDKSHCPYSLLVALQIV